MKRKVYVEISDKELKLLAALIRCVDSNKEQLSVNDDTLSICASMHQKIKIAFYQTNLLDEIERIEKGEIPKL